MFISSLHLKSSYILIANSNVLACQTNHLANTFEVKVTIGGDRAQEDNFLICNLTEPVAFFKKVKSANSTLKNIGPLCGNNTDQVPIQIEGNKLTFIELSKNNLFSYWMSIWKALDFTIPCISNRGPTRLGWLWLHVRNDGRIKRGQIRYTRWAIFKSQWNYSKRSLLFHSV